MKGILIIFAVLMFSALLFANPVWDTPINIRKTHNIDLSKSYATAADGSTIYVWSDVSSGSRDIYAQRIDHLGNKIWQEPLALTSSAGSQDYPVIKAYNTNEFVIAYYDYQVNSEGNIRVIKIDLAGTQLWQDEGVIASSSTGSKDEMKLLVVNQDIYLVWSDRMSGEKKLHGQRLNSLGNRQWGQLGQQLTYSQSIDTIRDIYANQDSGFMLVYEFFTSEIRSLFVMSYDSSGVAGWPVAKQIFPQDSQYTTLAAAHAPGYGYYTILQSIATNPNAISLAVCNEAGDFIRHTTLDSSSSGGYSWVASLIPGSDGHLFLSFVRFATYTFEGVLRSMKVTSSGSITWTTDPIQTSRFPVNLSVAGDTTDGMSLALSTVDSETYAFCIEAYNYDCFGQLEWNNPGVHTSPFGVYKINASYVGERFRIAWEDKQGAFFQELNAGGDAIHSASPKDIGTGLSGKMIPNSLKALQSQNRIFYTWLDDRGSTQTIYYQIIDYNGNILLEDNGNMLDNNLAAEFNFDVKLDSNGNMLIAWLAKSDADDRILKMQLISPDGTKLWGDGGVEIDNGMIGGFALSYSEGACYIAWEPDIIDLQTIKLQKVQNGIHQWVPGGITIVSTSIAFNQLYVSGMNDRYLVYTSHDRGTIFGYVIRFSPDGSNAWGSGAIPLQNNSAYLMSSNYSLKLLGNDLVISWLEFSAEQNNFSELKAQRVSPDGLLYAPAGGSLISTQNVEVDDYSSVVQDDGITHFVVSSNPEYNLFLFKHNYALKPLWVNEVPSNASFLWIDKQSLATCDDDVGVICFRDYLYDGYPIKYYYFDHNGLLSNTGSNMVPVHDGWVKTHLFSAFGSTAFMAWDHVCYRNQARWPEYPVDFFGIFVQKHDLTALSTPEAEVPAPVISLMQNYPNPFNPNTIISFELKDAGMTTLRIFNLKGQLVRTLQNGDLKAGNHQVQWDGKDDKGLDSASGVYLYQLNSKGITATKKMLIMK